MAPRVAVGEKRTQVLPESGVDEAFVVAESARCVASPHWFVQNHVWIEDVQRAGRKESPGEVHAGTWIPFHLWPAQYRPLSDVHEHQLCLWLKARQIGLTWLALAYALWTLVFRPGSTVLLFSLRDDEACELLRRLKGMFSRLPSWMIEPGTYDAKGKLAASNSHAWTLPDGGRAMAFPATAGDSYTASLVIIDEADLIPKLNNLLGSVKPTIDNGGKLVMVSRVNKDTPGSAFKNIYRAGRAGQNDYKVCFLPWYAHPSRTRDYYKAQVRHSLTTTLSLDYVHEQYPATDDEALSARQLDKRFPEAAMAEACVFSPRQDLAAGIPSDRLVCVWESEEDLEAIESKVPDDPAAPKTVRVRLEGGEWAPKPGKALVRSSVACPLVPGLRVYKMPEPGRRYTAGVDLGQGLPASNDSAVVVTDDLTGEEVASVHGKIAPKLTARYAAEISDWYSAPKNANCVVMVERNNHGHAFILWWESNRSEEHFRARLLKGQDGNVGWNQTASTKETMWHRAAQRVADKRVVIHTRLVYDQVLSIEANTLAAPDGYHDDLAVAWGLSLAAADVKPPKTEWTVKRYG